MLKNFRKKRGASTDRGAVAIMVAVFAIVAMLLLAFVVDRGYVYLQRNQLQNATDASALAAAQAFCGGTGDPVVIATDYARDNGVDVANGDELEVLTALGSTSYVNVRASRPVSGFFSEFANIDSVGVAAQATAIRTCNEGYAIFAGGGGFKDSGGMAISGSIYSDGQLQITSNANSVVDGRMEFTDDPADNFDCVGCDKALLPDGTSQTPQISDGITSISPACHAYSIGIDRPAGNPNSCTAPAGDTAQGLRQELTTFPANPADLTLDMCQIDSGWSTDYSVSANTILNCGANEVSIAAMTWPTNLRGVVTSGPIIVEPDPPPGEKAELTIGANVAGGDVLLMSESPDRAIEIKGNTTLFMNGYLYAPNGEVYVGGESNLSWNGSVIAQEVTINGTGSGGGNVGFRARTTPVRLVQ